MRSVANASVTRFYAKDDVRADGMGRAPLRSLVRVIVSSACAGVASPGRNQRGTGPFAAGVLGADSRVAGARALSWRRHRPGDPHPSAARKARGAPHQLALGRAPQHEHRLHRGNEGATVPEHRNRLGLSAT